MELASSGRSGAVIDAEALLQREVGFQATTQVFGTTQAPTAAGVAARTNLYTRVRNSHASPFGLDAADGSVDTTIQGHGRLSRNCTNQGQGSNRYEGLFHFKILQG